MCGTAQINVLHSPATCSLSPCSKSSLVRLAVEVREVTLIHQARNLVTVILGNIEIGNLLQALEAAERLEAHLWLIYLSANSAKN